MSATLPAGEYGIGKTLARAGERGPSKLDWVRLIEWRRLTAAGAPPLAAFVTVATSPEYGFKLMRGKSSLPPSSAATLFSRWLRRMAPEEVAKAHAETVLEVVSAAPGAARRMATLSTATVADGIDPDLARVNIAAGKVILEAVGVGGSRTGGGTVVNVAAVSSSTGPSPHDLAATIASDPEASRLYRELLDRMDAAAAKRADA